MGSIGPDAVAAAVASSDLHAKYGETIDRESAYEKLAAKVAAPPADDGAAPPPHEAPKKDEPGFIELHDESGFHNCLVFEAHCVADGEQILFL